MSEADQKLYDALRRISAKYPLPEVKWTGQLEMTQARVQQNVDAVLAMDLAKGSNHARLTRLDVVKARGGSAAQDMLLIAPFTQVVHGADNQPDK